LHFNNTDAEANLYSTSSKGRDLRVGQDALGNINVNGESYASWRFSRAPGFFDVVTFTGNNSEVQTVPHGLGVVPEMMWVKANSSFSWKVWYPTDNNHGQLILDTDVASEEYVWNWGAVPTETEMTIGGGGNRPGIRTVVYLFASVPGISKVGSYTGTGHDGLDVNCGFTTGARFVLIKRLDSMGDWYVWDTERGITAGDDPYLFLNRSAAEVTNTNYIAPLSSGFTLTNHIGALNSNGGKYLFYAIA
jgi:hypothetical protein